MWNGSNASWVAPRCVAPQNHRLEVPGLILCLLIQCAGCGQALARRSSGLSPEHGSPVAADRLYDLGLLYARQGDLQRAEQYLSAARDRGYDERAVVPWLVRVCVVAGRYHSALEHGVRHLRKWPDDWALRFVIASIYEALGDSTRAREELEAIVQSEPDRALPHYRLAMIFSQQHADPVMVRHHLQEYLRLAPDGAHGREAGAMLRTLSNPEPRQDSALPSRARTPPVEANP